MNKICLMVVWMGPLPKEYRLWLESVRMNPTIDFYVITDQNFPKNGPANVFYSRSTLSEVKAKFEEKLGMKICLKWPYKLCDFKPVWWMLMDERLSEYDYYGYCDIDLIFGDIRHFLTDDFVSKYDRCFDRGYFTLYKNTEEIRNYYKKSLDKDNMAYPYDKAFKTGYACYFDEFMGMGILYWQYGNQYIDQLEERLATDINWKALEFKSYKTDNAYLFHWKNGKLYRIGVDKVGVAKDAISDEFKGEEILLAHIQKRKMDICLDINEVECLKEFWFFPNKFTFDIPRGPIYSEKDKVDYAEQIRIADRYKRWDNLKKNGIIQYLPHLVRTRRIRRFIINKKGYF